MTDNDKLWETVQARIKEATDKDKDELMEVIKGVTNPEMIDITAPSHVEIKIRGDGKVLWVNVDGICKLRVCQIKELELIDERESLKNERT